MGRWVQLSKRHPEITTDNEVVNVLELGGPQGAHVVQGQHFFTDSTSPEAQELAMFLRTESPLQASDAQQLFRENLNTRLRDGYVHVRYFNFRLMQMVYVGEWNPALQRFV